MTHDILVIFYWWLILLGIGLVFLPLTFRVFGGFWDRGYAFGKILGILLISYTIWLLGSLKILPFFRETILLIIILFLSLNSWLATRKHGTSLRSAQKHRKFRVSAPSVSPRSLVGYPWKIIVFEELLFFICLAFWGIIRGFQPDIQGLEKFMDFGFVNSILRTKFFPPADMWFIGGTINYYYFGHFVTALLTKLSGIDSAITYNLMIATLFALAFTTTFSLTSNLLCYATRNPPARRQGRQLVTRKLILGGFIAALLLTLGANLHPAWYNFKMKILKQPYCNGSLNYWYPDATRYIGYCPEVEDKTIHEFPSYSFVVSDLHGHVLDIPFVLLFLALLLVLISHEKRKSLAKKSNIRIFPNFNRPNKSEYIFSSLTRIAHQFSEKPNLVLLPLTLGIMYMTNSWDLPIYFVVLGSVLLWLNYQKFGLTYQIIFRTALFSIIYFLSSLIFSLPFHLNFSQIAKGIAFVRTHSLPHQLLILWGAPWFFGSTFLLFLSKDKVKTLLRRETLVKRFSNLVGVPISLKKVPHLSPITYHLSLTDIFVLILLTISTLLVFIPEIFYVKDIYIPSYHRANTMFKLTYQAFIMYSITIGYIIVRVFNSPKRGILKFSLFTVHCSLLTVLMLYPFFSIKSYYGLKTYRGLYGLQFLERLYPDNHQAILWLKQNVSGQPVILEAAGDSYTDYNQISMATGLPTVEGWLVHEWLWRGSFDEPGKRASEVQQIYEGDSTTAKNLLKKYQVQYLIVSQLEWEKYPSLNETKFASLGQLVFSSGSTKVFKIKNEK